MKATAPLFGLECGHNVLLIHSLNTIKSERRWKKQQVRRRSHYKLSFVFCYVLFRRKEAAYILLLGTSVNQRVEAEQP